MLIESNQIYTPYTQQVAKSYLQPLLERNIDTLIYGCTHYRHLEQVFQEILPRSINIIDPAEHIAIAAEKELELMGLKSNRQPLPTRFCVSGVPQQFAQLSQQWLGCLPQVERVQMKDSSNLSITFN